MNEQLKIIISAEIDKLKKGVEDAQKHMKSFKDQVKDASKNVDDNIKKMGSGIASGLKVVGTTIAAAGGALLALGASTAEYRNEQAKLTTAFEAAGASAETAKTTYDGLVRVLGDSGQATEAAAHLAKLSTEEQALSEWTNICQGVYATFGDSLPIEGLTEAANETAKVGTVTGSLADALNWAGISEDEFNEKLAKCNSEAEREKLIRDTLNKTYDDAAKKYEKNNAAVLEQNEAQEKLRETTANLGEAVAPVVTAFTNFANDALAIVVPYIQQFAEEYGPQLKEVLEGVATALENAFTWASQHKELLMVIGGIIAGVVTAIGLYNAVAAVKAAMAALEVTSVWALVAAYAAQAVAVMAALAPYILIVAAIAAVIAIIVLVIKHWDDIKAKTIEVAQAMWEKIKEAVDKIVQFFEDLRSKVQAKVEEVKTKVVEKFQEIKSNITQKIQDAKQAVVDKFQEIKSSITEKVQSAKESVVNKFEEIKSSIKSKIDAAKQNVENVFNAVKEKIINPVKEAKEKVSNFVEDIKNKFNFSWKLPKPKFPTFSVIGGEAPWGFMGKGSLPKISINWNALGGVFDSPKLFNYGGSLQGIGEDGAEAVVPLEKNTQWLDRLAERLAAKQNGIPIVLQVDGKTFAQVSIDSINALTKQRGTLGLNLV